MPPVGALFILLATFVVWPDGSALRAQATSAGTTSAFVAGSRELFSLDLSQTAIGDFPASLRQLLGSMEVVEKDGKRMLRASDRSEFLITLPERLPVHFTLEIDLITRAEHNNEEIAFEGTPTLNRSTASAHVLWYQKSVTILGGRDAGGGSATVRVPDDLAAEIEGQPAEVRVDVNVDSFKLYTNGRRLLNLPDLKFVRGRVLRVFLGGHDTGLNAVHLSRLRIADAGTGGATVAQQQSTMTSTPASAANQSSSGGPGALALTGLTVTAVSGGGALVTWDPLPVTATYFVVRWNVNDPACCNTMSPPGLPLTSPVWQDSVLPLAGTYAYRVIATTASGTIAGETRYTYRGPATPPPGVPTPAPIPIPPPASAPAIASGPLPVPAPIPTTTTAATGVPRDQRVAPTFEPAPPPPVTILPAIAPAAPVGTGLLSPAPAPTQGTTGGTGATEPSNPGSGTSKFRVILTGAKAVRPTSDNLLATDGRGDEVFGAAAVYKFNRQLRQLDLFSFKKTRDYGDTGWPVTIPGRIRAGTFFPEGGIVAGDTVPTNFDPAVPTEPSPESDQLPLLLWEGALANGVDAVVIYPSLWSRNADLLGFEIFKQGWNNRNPALIMSDPAVVGQYLASAPSAVLAPTGGVIQAVPGLIFGPNGSRPIGMSYSLPLVTNYQERLIVLTRENLASLTVGSGRLINVTLQESADLMLGGNYTLYLRVERLQ